MATNETTANWYPTNVHGALHATVNGRRCIVYYGSHDGDFVAEYDGELLGRNGDTIRECGDEMAGVIGRRCARYESQNAAIAAIEQYATAVEGRCEYGPSPVPVPVPNVTRYVG